MVIVMAVESGPKEDMCSGGKEGEEESVRAVCRLSAMTVGMTRPKDGTMDMEGRASPRMWTRFKAGWSNRANRGRLSGRMTCDWRDGGLVDASPRGLGRRYIQVLWGDGRWD